MHSATTNYYHMHITEDQIYIRAAATTATTATENIEITVMFSVAYLAQSASMSNYRVARNFSLLPGTNNTLNFIALSFILLIFHCPHNMVDVV